MNSNVIPAKAGIHISLTMLMIFAGSVLCLADDPSPAQIKAENLDLKNKNAALIQQFNDIFNDRLAIQNRIKLVLDENAELKNMWQKKKRIKELPEDIILRKKLIEARLELMELKDKDEGLKEGTANMHYNLGAVLQAQNKYDAAIREFELDLNVNPDDADAYYNLALIYDKGKNNRQEAIDHYNMYLKINPDATDALQVKERLTDLETQKKIWGNPDAMDIGEKQTLGRL